MSDVDIVHPVPVEDAAPFVRAVVTTLLGDPYSDDFDLRVQRWQKHWLADRTWGVRDGDVYAATLATDPYRLAIPGPDGTTVDLPVVDGLTAVTVAATHRRRGILRRMLTRSLQRAKDAGDPLSILIAAEWPIYGRFGYAPAVWGADFVYNPRIRGGNVAPDPSGGRVRQIEPAELVGIAPDVYERARRRRAGQIDRSADWWARRLGQGDYEKSLGPRLHWFAHEGPDGIDGVVAWRVTRDFELDGRMGAVDVDELFATNDVAHRNLWAYLSGIDVIGDINFHAAPVDEPVRWLLPDGRALRETYRGDLMWVRMLDVPAALSARGYTGEASVVLEVVDDDLGLAGGTFRLETTREGAVCAPTSDSPDLTLSQRALSAIYLGGNSLRSLALGGGVDEHTPGTLGRVDALFATAVQPWNATMF